MRAALLGVRVSSLRVVRLVLVYEFGAAALSNPEVIVGEAQSPTVKSRIPRGMQASTVKNYAGEINL